MKDKSSAAKTGRHRARDWSATLVPPVVALFLGLAAWACAVWWFDIPRFLLPSPADVGSAAWSHGPQLLQATCLTAFAAICGYGISLIVGTAASMVFCQSRWIRAGLFPYAIFLQTVPIVAIAPLIVIWIGEGLAAVVVIAFVISLFPIVTNGTAGMVGIDRQYHELFDLNHATRWQRLCKLQLPGALPNLVTGARIPSGLSVLGAIVGEYFAGGGVTRRGLGYLIFTSKDQFELDTLFAAVLLCTLLGVILFAGVGWVGQRYLLHWQDEA